MSQLSSSGGQSIRASASVLPVNVQGWFPLELTGLISLQAKGLLQDHSSKASILWCSAFFTLYLDPADFTLCSYTAVFKILLYFNVVLVLSLTLSYHMTMLFYGMYHIQIICHLVRFHSHLQYLCFASLYTIQKKRNLKFLWLTFTTKNCCKGEIYSTTCRLINNPISFIKQTLTDI